MDNQRTILWGLFAAMAFLTWSQWQTQRPPPPPVIATPASSEAALGELPSLPEPPDGPAISATPDLPGFDPALPSVPLTPSRQLISVITDVLELEIDPVGGSLVSARLPAYPVSKDTPDVPVQLLNSDPARLYVLTGGFVDGSQDAPTHQARLTAEAYSYELSAGQDVIEVPLRWQNEAGLQLEKIYRFTRGRYDIELEYRVRNNSASDWRAVNYLQLTRAHNPPDRSMFDVDSYSFDGPVFYDTKKYDKLKPKDFPTDPLNRTLTGGWLAAIQHHFLSAIVPPPGAEYTYDSRYTGNTYTLRATGPALTVAAGAEARVEAMLFVGPKLQKMLDETAPGLALTVDYGMLAILARPLFWLLQQVHNYVGNWGWAIILVTVLIKLAFYKLTETSGRSMAKMRKLAPRLKTLQERYKDDRQQLSAKMMELYKTEKVNPAAGCLPMLIQIPFFIAFYWVLLESVEMRQEPFALWITDLSSRDPFFVLPLMMGVAMYVQQKLNPAPPDPIQAKVMTILPVMFTVFFAFFPAGLVLYWLTNSVLSVAQQWNINRKMGAD